MNWRNHHTDNAWFPGSDPCELILLMWLYYENTISSKTQCNYRYVNPKRLLEKQKEYFKLCYIWQTALEWSDWNQLDNKLNHNFTKHEKNADAQLVFCIDIRSEGLRRHIEAQGNLQTFGFAGFFGAIFAADQKGEITYQAPALVKTTQIFHKEETQNKLTMAAKRIKTIIDFTKKQFASPFALFEIVGLWSSLFMLYKVIQPLLKIRHKNSGITIKNTSPEQEQLSAAKNLLTTIGLVKNFSPYVLLCAHQTDCINNPFKSSLNCGACGGNSGIPNAIVMCDILNKQSIRNKLSESGIVIPRQTQFIPACHHTSYDQLEILAGSIPKKLRQAFDNAAAALRQEKITRLPGSNNLSQREKNWSELIPELGLINNTAMVIGPRELTFEQNLEQKVFLHSYEPQLDADGAILTRILCAPAIVAHWISSQYYFSTTNPELFGAGNKAIHNVLPGIGVLEGNLSDLKIGLPLQSTHFQSKPLHEPRRLIVVVYAQKETLDNAIANSPEFKTLLENHWIYLKHVEAK